MKEIKSTQFKNGTFKPSEFMKARRPEQFSDSQIVSEPLIPKEHFEYQLATITRRCQEKDFENFCRLLAQKEICPNLIIQTGSTGGGDSKVDTETYPVADDISFKWYEGIGRKAAEERWAFAISCQETWKPKVQDDVKKIALTNRGYTRIYFISSQDIRDKERAEYQDSLSAEYGIDIWILDKQWIIDKVYSNNRFDIAISALNLSYTENKNQIGFKDAEKLSDLAQVEKQIDDFDSSLNAGYQFVEDCLYAAILSRKLEKPQFEVYGRFERAKRAAEEFGVNNQLIRITYQHAWTAYWWFNDFKLANKLYDELEKLSINSINTWDLERLFNLFIVIQTATLADCLSPAEANLNKRLSSLFNTLSIIANDKTKLNSATAAKFLILLLELHQAFVSKLALSEIFQKIEYLLDSTHNLMDVPIEPLIRIIEELNNFIDDENLDKLFDKIIEISSERLSKSKKGELLIEKGIKKLNFDKHCEAIALFARAVNNLLQYENRREFICQVSHDHKLF